jgi:hypothetical protein
MPLESKAYKQAEIRFRDGSLSHTGHTWKLALVKSSYVPNLESDSNWADVSGHEASGGGYSTGGVSLASLARSTSTAGKIIYSANNISLPNVNITARYGVVYSDTHTSKALICCIDFGEDKTSSGGNFDIAWPSTGVYCVGV